VIIVLTALLQLPLITNSVLITVFRYLQQFTIYPDKLTTKQTTRATLRMTNQS